MAKELATLAELDAFLGAGGTLSRVVCQDLDLQDYTGVLVRSRLSDSLFLGCGFEPEGLRAVIDGGGLVFPSLEELPYRPYRSQLYSPEELFDGHRRGVDGGYDSCFDGRIYAHYGATGGPNATAMVESLARQLHDHAVTDALHEVIVDRKIVASAGTIQEMIFFGTEYWTQVKPVYPLLAQLAANEPYGELLAITDDPDEIIDLIERFAVRNSA